MNISQNRFPDYQSGLFSDSALSIYSITNLSNQAHNSSDGVFCVQNPDDEAVQDSLDLIYGHLTYKSNYSPVNLTTQVPLNNWFVPSSSFLANQPFNFVLTIQPFKAGGYEVNCKTIDLVSMRRRMESLRATGKRVKPEQVNDDDLNRSVRRSKTRSRHLMKSLGCDRLLTLTIRESLETGFASLDDWKSNWTRFLYLCAKNNIKFDYVAIPERHKKGNYHLHVAINSYVSIKLIRNLWLRALPSRSDSKTAGNVDIRYRQDLTYERRLSGIAKYLSKYLFKQMEFSEFNKKRYWSVKHELPPKERFVLSSLDFEAAIREFCGMLSIDFDKLVSSRNFFKFPAYNGFWVNFDPGILAPPPF